MQEYESCHWLQHGLSFENDHIEMCCLCCHKGGGRLYVKANYFINPPSQIQLTDPRPKMPGITLIDMNTAIQLADDSLTQNRTLKSGKLQYATEKIFDSRGIFQGYVLTPVWHFVFHPTEEELQQGYCSMILDIDAVTSDVLQWYTTESEQSGEKCWTTHTENE